MTEREIIDQLLWEEHMEREKYFWDHWGDEPDYPEDDDEEEEEENE